jgi:pimeloyl-ACP methyl ester carboxylesterase
VEPLGLLHDFGGDGPVVHVAHANGFPPGTYQPLAEYLTDRYHVIGLAARPLWPGSKPESAPAWRVLANDMAEGLEARGLGGVAGIGHSLGGILTLWAAIHRPALFSSVILIDPVLLLPSWPRGMWLLRRLGLGQRQPLVQGALRRRSTWPDRQACYEYLREKSFFDRWPDSSLNAYVESGTHSRPDGQIELVYPPEWEAHIFATTPLNIWRDIPHLGSPVLVIRGEFSRAFRPEAEDRLTHLLPRSRVVTIPDAGHLAPMEKPAETGKVIRDWLDDR